MSIGMSSSLTKPLIHNTLKKNSSTPSERHCLGWVLRSGRQHKGHGCDYFISLGRDPRSRVRMIVNSNVQPIPPPPAVPSNPSPGGFGKKGWIAGLVLSMLLPFLTKKWGPLLFYKREIDTIVQTVEDTVEVIEKVAEGLEEVAEDVAEKLPEGQLKRVATLVEHLAEVAAKDAHLADAAIDKVQELEDEVESYIESIGSVKNEEEKSSNKLKKQSNN